MSQIAIVMASDEGYAMAACVAMYSILNSKNPSTSYKFYLLVQEKFNETILSKFDELFSSYPESCLELIKMGTWFNDAPTHFHITKESYYRLSIPDILPNVGKCIWLDVDIIVRDDLTDLWNFNLGDNYIAAVSDVLGQHRCKELGISCKEQYINAGVLLINVNAMRKDNIVDLLLSHVDKGYIFADQDILNKVCLGRISLLPLKYNILIPYALDLALLADTFTSTEVDEALNNPVVIHYNASTKPWNSHSIHARLYHLWYCAAADSPFNFDVKEDLFNKKNKLPLKPDFFESRYDALYNSITFRIGRLFMFLPRILKRVLKL